MSRKMCETKGALFKNGFESIGTNDLKSCSLWIWVYLILFVALWCFGVGHHFDSWPLLLRGSKTSRNSWLWNGRFISIRPHNGHTFRRGSTLATRINRPGKFAFQTQISPVGAKRNLKCHENSYKQKRIRMARKHSSKNDGFLHHLPVAYVFFNMINGI